MKKILSIALVALLAASTVFAGISGSASVSLGYDTTSKEYGMSNGSGIDANIELATETAEKVAEGSVYAGIKATMKLAVAPWKGEAKDLKDSGYLDGFDGIEKSDEIVDALGVRPLLWVDGDAHELGLWLSLDEAYVAGADWKLSITGGKGAPDYAKSAIDTTDKDVKDDFGNEYDTTDTAVTYKLSAWNATGVALTYKGFTVAGGFSGNATENAEVFAFNLFAETPKFEFEGGSVQAAAIVARDGSTDDDGNYTALDKTNIGFSAKADYALDAFSAKVATDLGIENVEDATVKLDVAANVSYSPVALDVYYQHTDKDLLSLKLSGTIAPVTASVYTKDVLSEETRSVGGEVEATLDAFTLGTNASYTIKAKKFSIGANVKYAAEIFTAKAGVNFGKTFDVDNTSVFYLTASVESEALIPGAKLSLSYGKDSAKGKMNFLDKQETAQNFGAITAKCEIAF